MFIFNQKMPLTRFIRDTVHTFMFMYACFCAFYLLQELVPQHFIAIEALPFKLWGSTLKPVCMAVIDLIIGLFQDHYKDFLWVVEALDINHFVSTIISRSHIVALVWKLADILGRLASYLYGWITLEKFVYIYPVAFWVFSFMHMLINRYWRRLDSEEMDAFDEEGGDDDKSGDEGDDEDSDQEGDDDDGPRDQQQQEEDFDRGQQQIHRMRRPWVRPADRRRRGGETVHQVNNVGPMYNSVRLDDRLCSICCENERNAVLLPCGHTNLCLQCAYNYHDINKSCPFCQMTVETMHRIFL